MKAAFSAGRLSLPFASLPRVFSLPLTLSRRYGPIDGLGVQAVIIVTMPS